jgi:hypothetical protein
MFQEKFKKFEISRSAITDKEETLFFSLKTKTKDRRYKTFSSSKLERF